jgi:hypothetical protein
MSWKEVTAERYHEMLDCLPPAVWTELGFLVGEPRTHQVCKVTRQVRNAYPAFIQYKGSYWEAEEAMTAPEFRSFKPDW